MKDNTIYIYAEQYLNHYHRIKNYSITYTTDKMSIETYRKRTNDHSKIIILKKKFPKDKRMWKGLLKGNSL